jgi:hypothetical protein
VIATPQKGKVIFVRYTGSRLTPRGRIFCHLLVDFAPMKVFVAGRRTGLLFTNRTGSPLSQTNLLRRSLHPILKEFVWRRPGFHAMRRFRATWLRKQTAPEDTIKFWIGHANESVTDKYSKLADDVEFRMEIAEAVGTGFDVTSSLRPMRPNKSKEKRMEVCISWEICGPEGLELSTFWFVGGFQSTQSTHQPTPACKSQQNQRKNPTALGPFRLLLYPLHGQ